MKSFSSVIRTLHRDLGYFAIGLTLIYAISGIILAGRGLGWFQEEFTAEVIMATKIDRKDFNNSFKKEVSLGHLDSVFDKKTAKAVQRKLKLKLKKKEGDIYSFNAWRTLDVVYDSNSGHTVATYKSYPRIIKPFIDVHKSSHNSAWFYISIIYSVILSFLAVSSFWLIKGKNGFMKRGIYFMLAGFVVVAPFLFYS